MAVEKLLSSDADADAVPRSEITVTTSASIE